MSPVLTDVQDAFAGGLISPFAGMLGAAPASTSAGAIWRTAQANNRFHPVHDRGQGGCVKA